MPTLFNPVQAKATLETVGKQLEDKRTLYDSPKTASLGVLNTGLQSKGPTGLSQAVIYRHF